MKRCPAFAHLRELQDENCCSSIGRSRWMICVFRRETVWKPCVELEKDSTAFVLTISGGFVLRGIRAMPVMWRLWTTIEVHYGAETVA